jgi:hypothetical protein
MPRSGYIYHLYEDGKRIFSGTVKHEVLWFIHENNKTGPSYKMTVSRDASEGEGEVIGWREKPKIGESPNTIDGFSYKITRVNDLTNSGNWSVELESYGKMMIRWNNKLGCFEEVENVKKRKR